MDDNGAVLECECPEPEGTFVRIVRPCLLSLEKVTELFLRLKDHQVLFGNARNEDEKLRLFLSNFFEFSGDTIEPRGLIWEVDDVGIIFLTNIDMDNGTADAHYAFWDRRFSGREALCKKMVKHIFSRYGFRKLNAKIPLHAWRAFHTAELIGFKKEGRIRKEALFRNEWFDVNYYSILREEVLNGVRS